jgi:hypothetical protein
MVTMTYGVPMKTLIAAFALSTLAFAAPMEGGKKADAKDCCKPGSACCTGGACCGDKDAAKAAKSETPKKEVKKG